MQSDIEIRDQVIWFKHIHAVELARRLGMLGPDAEVLLQIDEVIGPWQRMKSDKTGRMTNGLRPVGAMKPIWRKWFQTRKGQKVTIREVTLADDYLAAAVPLFSEWSGPEDEEAFRDL